MFTTKKYNTRSSTTTAVNKQPDVVSSAKSKKIASVSKSAEPIKKYKHHESSDEDEDDEEDLGDFDSDTDEEDDDEDDDEEDDEEDDDDEDDWDEDENDDDEFAMEEYQKFLNELFPSKYMKKRAATSAANISTPTKSQKPDLCCPPAPKKKRSHKKEEEEEEEPSASESDSDADFGNAKGKKKNPSNFNISFVIRNSPDDGDYMTANEALYDEDFDEDEDEDFDEDFEEEEKKYKPKTLFKQTSSSLPTSPVLSPAPTHTDEMAGFLKMKTLFANLSQEDLLNPTIKKMIDEINEKEQKFLKKTEAQAKKTKTKNTKKLKSLLKERDVMNDLQYFNEKMTIEEQEKALAQIEIIKEHSSITKPYRLTLLEADIPPQYKAIAYRKISTLRYMEPGGGEYYKMKNWVDAFMQIPFGKYRNLPITMADGVEKCHAFMDNAKQILDQAVYGLNDAKLQIMQMIGQWIVNPAAIGTAIAIKGPMGTGKTTLVKDGISKILGRDFVFIALGGATDSSFLEGHSYTYEGSMWGKIVDLLIKCKSMNPVIYFDELDKISDTPKGEEIAGILTHLTDTTQNSQFHDRYFSDIDFDLSRCLFIFSYNDESKVNRILLDRMYRIQTKGYDQAQKTTIANNYLMPKICEQVKFQTADIIIPEATMHYIITNYTDKEDGVRTLKRCLEIVFTKLNLYRLMRPETNIFENEMSIKVEFPMQVTPEIVDKLIKKNTDAGSWQNMYM